MRHGNAAARHINIFPANLALGEGNMRWTSALTYYGPLICASGFLAGALVGRAVCGRADALQLTS